MAWAAPTLVKDTKHNLQYSATNPNAIYSKQPSEGGTTEICVFCHTPHSAQADAPLWNRQNVAGPYTPYDSDVMSALSYSPGDASLGSTKLHVKTRICLSCHDGTIALGQLVNLPYDPTYGVKLTGKIPMQGIVGTTTVTDGMPWQSAGYIGTDLSDDHPVAIKYISGPPPGKDPELRSSIQALTAGGPIWLYDNNAAKTQDTTGTGYIECTSCHDPHNNEYGNFLVGSNSESKICTSCHDKIMGAVTTTPHHGDTANVSYNPDGSNPPLIGTRVGEVRCMNCHFPHKAGGSGTPPNLTPDTTFGKYLLTFQKDNTCFNNTTRWNVPNIAVCHGTNATNVNGKNIAIEGEMSKQYAHNYDSASYGTKHQATEGLTSGWGNSPDKWHVECADCHNPHTAGAQRHSDGSNTIGNNSPLYGAGGVSVQSWPGTWSTVLNFTPFDGLGVKDRTSMPLNYYEYQICFKCHSSWYGTLPAGFTDQAKEFNPTVNTFAFHPVAGPNYNGQGTTSRFAPWDADGLTMYCSDCHTKENDAVPKGPHGSSNPSILQKPFDYNPGTLGGGVGGAQSSGDICFVCHKPTTYLTPSTTDTSATGFSMTGGNNLHAKHASYAISAPTVTTPYSYKCVNCHIRIPHGWNRKAMVAVSTDATPYNNGAKIAGSPAPNLNTGSYVKGDCTTASGCHQ